MESFGLYLLKSAVWLTGFTIVFLVLLRNERYFRLNRAYLLSGILASVVFPFFTWHYAVILPSVPSAEIAIPEISTQTMVYTGRTITPGIPVYWWFYLVGITWFAFRLFRQTWIVVRKLRKTGYVINGPVKLVRTPEYVASFSFFSFVFVNPSTSDIETEEIVNHECGHIQKLHWFDLLFVELVCMMQWFNPFVWIYSHLVRQNHEYLADEMALQRTSNPAIYRATLLNQMLGVPLIRLANSFSYSLNKKRFKMMKKRINSPFRKLKMLLVIPLIAFVFYAFAKPEYISSTNVVQSDNIMQVEKGNVEKGNVVINNVLKDKVVKGKVVKPDGNPLWGTSVIIKGTTIGTITDKRGNFRLKDVPQDGELIFSFVGYQTAKMKPDFEKSMVIRMDAATIGIDEVVVVSYGTDKTPPSTPTLPIRTISSPIDSINPPMYVVDGTIVTETIIKSINSESIQSVNILKDQSAIEKYGDKAKNGVIEATLKKDAKGWITSDSLNHTRVSVGSNPFNKDMNLKNFPLIYLDGVIIDRSSMTAINPNNIESISCFKDKSAIATYGEKAKDGVILITSKRNFSGLESNNSTANPSKIESFNPKHPPLYIVDGVITDTRRAQYFLEIGAESVTVLKGKSAIDKYGENGINGVVEMVLKKKVGAGQTTKKAEVSVISETQKKDKDIFVVVEEMPEFPGGNEALMKFIMENIRYPAEAGKVNAQGNVIVNFVVKSSGKVENAKVVKSVHPALDNEALRVIGLMPDWKPGTQRGKAVDVSYTLPIQFTLQ